MLGPLANNGGPTQTHAVLPGSPAINAGNNCVLTDTCSGLTLGSNLTTDQRGITRPQQTTTDIGAFESRGFTLALSNGNNQSTFVNTNFANPLAVTVTSAFNEPVNGGQVTFTPPVSGASAVVAGNPATITAGTATSGTVTANNTIGGPYNVVASAIGSSASVNFALTNLNQPPTITPTVGVTRQRGSAGSNSTIATVSDLETPAGSLTVTVNGGSSATDNLVTISNIAVSAAGVVTADIVANCLATPGNFTLRVTDGGGLSTNANLTILVTANTAPVLTYSNPPAVVFGQATTVSPASGPSDNGSVVSTVLQSAGTFTGTISVHPTSGVVSVSNAGPVGVHTITIRATDNCSLTTDSTFQLTVNRADTTTLITSDLPDPSVVGESYTVNAVVSTPTPTPVAINICTPSTTVTEGDLFPGGIVTFGVTSGPGSVVIDHVNAGLGTQSITVVGTPVNAIVNVPAFTPGTFAPVAVTFAPVTPGLGVDFTLRAAGGNPIAQAAFIRVRCADTCTPSTLITEGDLNPGGIVTFA